MRFGMWNVRGLKGRFTANSGKWINKV